MEPAATSPAPQTLVEMLEARHDEPGRPFLKLVDPAQADEQHLQASQLRDRALRAAAALLAQGLEPGARLLLLLPNGLAFVETLFGALLAGVVPVIYPPPHTARRLPRYLAQLGRIVEQCRPRAAVLDAATLAAADGLELGGLRLVGPPDVDRARPLAHVHRPQPEDAAIVQYSSGSTGDPKGAVLSHRAILANGRAIGAAIEATHRDVMLSWLPLCHDMGLFGGLVFAWQHGWQTVHLQPHHFLVEPAIWLQAMARHRATITIAPNFAYSLCVHGIEPAELAGVELSSLRVAFNGAEPISRRAVEAFLERFEPYGLRREALFPVYGMAENTLAVCFPPVSRGPRFDRILRSALELEGTAVPAEASVPASEVKEVASVGRPLEGVELCILDEKDAPLPERQEGEIAVRGTSLLSGYLANPRATAAALRGGWLHTGDRGYLAGGELHVTGRVSDLIIRAGRNLHPQDLEALVEPLDGVRRGCVAALAARAADDSTDEVILMAETRLPRSEPGALEALRRRIRETLLEALDVAPERIVLLEPRSLPKTSSGKLQRRLALRLLQDGELHPLLPEPGGVAR